jgi:ParB-like nuclease family protein
MKDPKTENFLRAGGYKFDYAPRVLFKEIDIDASRANPARLLKKVDEERALNYAIAMERGDIFPAIVLLTLDNSKFKYLIATGVHRHRAYDDLDIDHCDAYIVREGDEYRRESLIRLLNTLEGYGVSQKDRIVQALEMHQKYPVIPMVQLAGEWSVRPDTLKTAITEQKAVDRGLRLGHNFTDGRVRLPQRSILALNQIHSDVIFDRAASFAMETGATTNEILDLCGKAKKARDEQSGLALVTEAAALVARRRQSQRVQTGRLPQAPSSKVFHGVRSLNNLASRGIDKLFLKGHPDRPGFRLVCEEGIDTLKRIIEALDTIDRQEGGARPAPPPGPRPPQGTMH